MPIARSHTLALLRIAEATLPAIAAVDPTRYELPWEGMHGVAVALGRVGAVEPATRALAATEPVELRALASACVASRLLRLDDRAAAIRFAVQAEALVDRCEHAGARAHTLAELASVRARLGAAKLASQHLRAAQALAPTVRVSLSVAATMARVHVEAGCPRDAQLTLDAGPWDSPFPVVHHGAGELRTLVVALAEAGAWSQAMQLSERCVERSGDDIDLHEDIRLALARRGRIEDLRACLDRQPLDDADANDAARLRLLLVLHGHGALASALGSSVEAPSALAPIDPDDPDAQLDDRLRVGDFAGARSWLGRVTSSDLARDYACSRYIDACVEGFVPEAIAQLIGSGSFCDPVAEAMELRGALSKLGVFAFG